MIVSETTNIPSVDREEYKTALLKYLPYDVNMWVPNLIWTGNPPEPSHEEMGTTRLTTENLQAFIDSGWPLVLNPYDSVNRRKIKNWSIEDLLKYHFDTDNYIEKGIAININEIL